MQQRKGPAERVAHTSYQSAKGQTTERPCYRRGRAKYSEVLTFSHFRAAPEITSSASPQKLWPRWAATRRRSPCGKSVLGQR